MICIKIYYLKKNFIFIYKKEWIKMSCPGGSEHDAKAVDGVNTGSSCTGNCWATGANVKVESNNNYNNGGEENRDDGIYEDHDEDWVKE